MSEHRRPARKSPASGKKATTSPMGSLPPAVSSFAPSRVPWNAVRARCVPFHCHPFGRRASWLRSTIAAPRPSAAAPQRRRRRPQPVPNWVCKPCGLGLSGAALRRSADQRRAFRPAMNDARGEGGRHGRDPRRSSKRTPYPSRGNARRRARLTAADGKTSPWMAPGALSSVRRLAALTSRCRMTDPGSPCGTRSSRNLIPPTRHEASARRRRAPAVGLRAHGSGDRFTTASANREPGRAAHWRWWRAGWRCSYRGQSTRVSIARIRAASCRALPRASGSSSAGAILKATRSFSVRIHDRGQYLAHGGDRHCRRIH